MKRIELLPNEIVLNILLYLDRCDIYNISKANKRFNIFSKTWCSTLKKSIDKKESDCFTEYLHDLLYVNVYRLSKLYS